MSNLQSYSNLLSVVSNVVKWFDCHDCNQHGLKTYSVQFCCVFEKDTLQQFSLLGGPWQAVLNFIYIFIKIELDSNILVSPKSIRGHCLPYILAPLSLSCELI